MSQWYSVVAPLRAACSRTRSFLWLLAALAGLCARSDLLGVTRIVRTLGLAERCYDRLLDFFHSPALDVAHFNYAAWRKFTRLTVRSPGDRLPVRALTPYSA